MVKKLDREASQKWVPVKDIRYGMSIVNLGGIYQYNRTMDIVPINFHMRTKAEKLSIVENFSEWIKTGPEYFQIMITSMDPDITQLTNNTRMAGINETVEKVDEARADYLRTIEESSVRDSISKRFFLTISYEGASDGLRATSLQDIASEMQMEVNNTTAKFGEIGLGVRQHESEDTFTAELMYKQMNIETSKDIPYWKRRERMTADARYIYGQEDISIDIANVIAPQTLDTTHPGYLIVDGIYHTYLVIRSDGYNGYVASGWFDILTNFGSNVAVVAHFQKRNRDIVVNTVKQSMRNNEADINRNEGVKRDKVNSASRKYLNNDAIYKALMSGEDLYDTVILIQITAKTLKDLNIIKRKVKKTLRQKEFYTTDCYNRNEEAFKMMLPINYVNKEILAKGKRNFLTSSIASTFPFTAYELMDSEGVLFGINSLNSSLVVLNPWNTQQFSNPNGVIVGSSGSGKTFFELLIGSHLRIYGISVIYVLPMKGYEYYRAVKRLGGEYIQLAPGSNACVNLFAIRPEAEVDIVSMMSQLINKGAENNEYTPPSLLAKKIRAIKCFLSLCLQTQGEKLTSLELGRIDTHLIRMYGEFGISSDNKSIFNSDGTLKKMPTFSDFKSAICSDDDMKRIASVIEQFITGTCRNLDQQTNIDIDNKLLAIDVDSDIIGEDLLPAFTFLAVDLAYDIMKRDISEKCISFLDEVWKMTVNPATAAFVIEMFKIVRGYGSAVWVATQEIDNLINVTGTSESFANTIINNSDIKVALKSKAAEAVQIQKVLKLNTKETQQITNFKRGMGLLIAGSDRLPVWFKATKEEIEAFTTDPNIIRELLEGAQDMSELEYEESDEVGK